jgi:hypothetical protein
VGRAAWTLKPLVIRMLESLKRSPKLFCDETRAPVRFAQLPRVAQRAKIAEAIRYGFNHWDGLTQYLDDGRIEIDSNTVERSIRPIAVNADRTFLTYWSAPLGPDR